MPAPPRSVETAAAVGVVSTATGSDHVATRTAARRPEPRAREHVVAKR